MIGILEGFAAVAIVIIAGLLLARSGVLGRDGGRGLNMAVFWLAMPCMLIDSLASRDTAHVLGPAFLVAAGSALLTGLVYQVAAGPLLGQRGAERIVGGMSASYNNVANLGIPIVVAVIGDASVVVPALLFQIGFYAPLNLTVLDTMTSRSGHVDWRAIVTSPFRNPMTISAIIGLTLSNVPWHPPSFVMAPVHMLGQAAVPMALLAFGASMWGAPVLRRGISPRRAVALSSSMKLLVHPLLAWVLGRFVFGMDGVALLGVVVAAALPTAQNVFTFASRYGSRVGSGVVQARDSGVVTTLACMPVILVIAALLG